MLNKMWEQVTQMVGWIGLLVTAVTTLITGIRALIRGPKEDKVLEIDIQDRITAMAKRWLKEADDRLKETEAKAQDAEQRATAAEAKVSELIPRVKELEQNLFSALNTLEIVYAWAMNGLTGPKPILPAWIFEWIHARNKMQD